MVRFHAPICRITASLIMIGAISESAHAQNAAAFDPQGVYIDPAGVLRTRRDDTGRRLRNLRVRAARARYDEQFAYISLPALFAEARKTIEAGKPLPDDVRYLKGMVKLQYVFVYPEQQDLVIAGPAEPIDTEFPNRPIGLKTGRPVLQLDDLVTAMRTAGPGRTETAFGCTIDLSQEAMNQIVMKLNELALIVKTQPTQRRAVADAMADAAGLQPVSFYNIDQDTRFAWVCVEADYTLKRLAIGLDRAPISAVISYLHRQTSPETNANRFWIEPMYEPLLVSREADAYEIRGQSLQIKTRRSFTDEDDPDNVSPAARAFTDKVTEFFTRISTTILPFADLANLTDLALLATLIGTDNLHEKVGWDIAWVMDERGYPVAKVPVPHAAPALVNFNTTRRMVIYAGGGVKLDLSESAADREPDSNGVLRANAHRPDTQQTWGELRPAGR